MMIFPGLSWQTMYSGDAEEMCLMFRRQALMASINICF